MEKKIQLNEISKCSFRFSNLINVNGVNHRMSLENDMASRRRG